MVSPIWGKLSASDKQKITEYYNNRESANTELDFVPAMGYKTHHNYNYPNYDTGDLTEIAVLKSNGEIRLDAPNVTVYPCNKVVWDNATNTYTKTVVYDGKEIKMKYTLTVKNKGTANEEVTRITLPSGEYIDFEGWDI